MTIAAKWVVAGLFLALGSSVQAQKTSPHDKSASGVGASIVSVTAEAKGEEVKLELAVLRARLDEERTHNAAVLQTVYWSLSVLVTLAVALIGFGWFANFRVYERDKEALMKALHGELGSGLADARQTISEAVTALREQALQHADTLRIETASSIDLAIRGQLSDVDERLRRFDKALSAIELSHELLNSDYLFGRQLHGNAFTSSIKAASLAKDLGRNGTVESILNDLEKRLEGMNGVYGSDIQKISTFVEGLDGIAPVQKERLIDVLRRVKKL